MASNTAILTGQLSQLSGAMAGGGGGGMSALAGLKDPSMVYIGILGSRSVADELIRHFHLQDVYKTKKLSQTERYLAKQTKVLPGKDSVVKITVDDHDPKRAADLANAYLKALISQSDRLALTDAAQRRAYFERQLESEKNALADSEVALTKIEQQTGIIHPAGQAEMQIGTIGQTYAAISSREVALAALSQGATDENPGVVRLRSEIAGLRAQLSQLENSNGKGAPGNVRVPTAKMPQLTLDYVRGEREVKFHEALYESLLRQYEAAKLDESRSAPMIQVVDSAQVPDSKSWPPRVPLVLLCALLGLAIGAASVLYRQWASSASIFYTQ
jgi:uncharacterized protein involved in exopolysaccharide biosynthesis